MADLTNLQPGVAHGDRESAGEGLVRRVLSLHRQMIHVHSIFSKLAAEYPHAEYSALQHQIYSTVILDPITIQFPPTQKFRTRFLKELISKVEKEYNEVNEDLLAHYLNLLGGLQQDFGSTLNEEAIREVCYKSYTLPDSRTISIKMADQLDNVGLTSWEAGFFLAEFFLANPHLLAGTACLELGAGIGFTGIVLSKLQMCRRLWLTDYEQTVLQNLRDNVLLNAKEGDTPVEVSRLDWEKDDIAAAGLEPDLILAADVVYDRDLIELLTGQVLKQLLASPPNGPKRVAYIASTRRNPTTYAHFLQCLDKNGISHKDITAESQFADLFEYPRQNITLELLSL